IGVPSARRPARRWLSLSGARLHNLAGVDVRIPLGTLTVVTGVSGSGKSTLVHDVLYRQLEARLTGAHTAKQHLGEPVGEVRAVEGWDAIADVVLVDQAPIGRTPRSNPVTYIKAFDELRALFAAEPLRLARALWHLQQVGLGYLRLGQPATTLSGGEAQRLKIARELAVAGSAKRRGRKLYILDEPTTGLHLDDVRTLCRVLDRLVDAGH